MTPWLYGHFNDFAYHIGYLDQDINYTLWINTTHSYCFLLNFIIIFSIILLGSIWDIFKAGLIQLMNYLSVYIADSALHKSCLSYCSNVHKTVIFRSIVFHKYALRKNIMRQYRFRKDHCSYCPQFFEHSFLFHLNIYQVMLWISRNFSWDIRFCIQNYSEYFSSSKNEFVSFG